MGIFSFKKHRNGEKANTSEESNAALTQEKEEALLKTDEQIHAGGRVEDIINQINENIANEIGWKYLKSRRCIKNTLGKLVFEIHCYSSKWNLSGERIEVKWEFRLWTKEYDKIDNVNSIVCHYTYENKDKYYYNITTEKELREVLHIVIEDIKNTAVFFYEQFDRDYTKAVRLLLNEDNFHKFHVQLDFLADNLGIDAIREMAKKEYEGYPELLKQQIERYRSGEKMMESWILNRCNTRYIADHDDV